MPLRLLDHAHQYSQPIDLSLSGMLIGALMVLVVAGLTIAAANVLARKSPAAPAEGNVSEETRDDTWPPAPKR
ncbi:MAG: hypothetical protein ABIY70_10155 [Capsulimonas sp.]|uniref:hypothetical protein n=1 Tax=Capsulimonas sp. TaxID=2494211 RepID=UPI0032634645